MFLANIVATASGFLREAVIAHRFGTSGSADAFALVIYIFDTFQAIAVAGIATYVLIPFVARDTSSRTDPSTGRAVGSVVVGSVVAVAILAGLFALFATPITSALMGASGAQARSGAARMLLLSAPALPLIFAGGLVATLLQGRGYFAAAGIGRLILNAAIAAALLILVPRLGFIAGAFALLIAGVTQLLFVIVLVRYADYRLPLVMEKSERLVEILGAAAPALCVVAFSNVILGGGERYLASTGREGNLAVLSYAWRLYFVFLALGIALQAVSFTRLSERHGAGKSGSETLESIYLSLRSGIFLLVPLSVGAMIMAETLVTLAYLRGRFDSASAHATSVVFGAYMLSLIPAFAIGVVIRSQFAIGMGWIAVRSAAVWAVVALLIDAVLISELKLVALPIGFALGCTAGTVHGLRTLESKLGGRILSRLGLFVGQMVAVVAVAFLPLLIYQLRAEGSIRPDLPHVLPAAGIALVCAATFIWLSKLLRVDEAREVISLLSAGALTSRSRR